MNRVLPGPSSPKVDQAQEKSSHSEGGVRLEQVQGAEVSCAKPVSSSTDAVTWNPGPCCCYAGFCVSDSFPL